MGFSFDNTTTRTKTTTLEMPVFALVAPNLLNIYRNGKMSGKRNKTNAPSVFGTLLP